MIILSSCVGSSCEFAERSVLRWGQMVSMMYISWMMTELRKRLVSLLIFLCNLSFYMLFCWWLGGWVLAVVDDVHSSLPNLITRAETFLKYFEGGQRRAGKGEGGRGGGLRSPPFKSHSGSTALLRLTSVHTYLLQNTRRSLVAEFEGKKDKVWRPSHPRVHHDMARSVVKK